MKKYLALIIAAVMALSACTSRTAPNPSTPEEAPPTAENSVTNSLEEAPEVPAAPAETPAESPSEEEKEDEADETTDDEAGDSQSGTFSLLDSGYQITLSNPFSGIYDAMTDGFYISAKGDNSLQGIVSFTDSADEVKSIEENITVLNDTLKADDTVKDFQYDRAKDEDGLYSITFTYRTTGDAYSSAGYNYVLYRQTDGGMITVMFTAQDSSYEASIDSVFESVVPATADAVEPPTR